MNDFPMTQENIDKWREILKHENECRQSRTYIGTVGHPDFGTSFHAVTYDDHVTLEWGDYQCKSFATMRELLDYFYTLRSKYED